MLLEIGDRASADDRDTAAQPFGQSSQQRLQPRRDGDRLGRLGEIDQSAVEVEEERRIGKEREGRAPVWNSHAPRWQARRQISRAAYSSISSGSVPQI